MDQIQKYTTPGIWIFAFLTAMMLTVIYAVQETLTILVFICVIISIIMSLGLLLLLLQSNKALVENEQELSRMKQNEKARLQSEQRTTKHDQQQTKIFKVDEALARIMPEAGTDFDSATAYAEKILQNIAKEIDVVQGLIYILNDTDQLFHILGDYAYYSEEKPRDFPLGETLSGQVAKNKKLLNLKELPDGYITILSGLGKSNPRHLIIVPVLYNYESIGIIELASFKPFGRNDESLIMSISESMAGLLNEFRS